jgi:hypothetical protein
MLTIDHRQSSEGFMLRIARADVGRGYVAETVESLQLESQKGSWCLAPERREGEYTS